MCAWFLRLGPTSGSIVSGDKACRGALTSPERTGPVDHSSRICLVRSKPLSLFLPSLFHPRRLRYLVTTTTTTVTAPNAFIPLPTRLRSVADPLSLSLPYIAESPFSLGRNG